VTTAVTSVVTAVVTSGVTSVVAVLVAAVGFLRNKPIELVPILLSIRGINAINLALRDERLITTSLPHVAWLAQAINGVCSSIYQQNSTSPLKDRERTPRHMTSRPRSTSKPHPTLENSGPSTGI